MILNLSRTVKTINFSLATESIVEVAVYDGMGRVVRMVANGKKNSGKHSTRFDAGDLPTGIYYCRMRAWAFTQMQRLVLMK